MKIRPKIPIFQNGGMPSTVTWTDPKSTWFTRSGDFGILEGTYNYLKPLYDKWKSSGKQEDYQDYKKAVDTLNSNQRYGYAPKHLQYQSGNNQLYRDNNVGAWQTYVRDNYKFINDSIGNNFSKYKIHSSNPYSGDNSGKEWKVDNLWAGITDDRTTWGNLLNPNDPNYQKWKQKFSEIGIDYRTNPEWNTGDVLYGFLKEENSSSPSLNNPPSKNNPVQQENPNKEKVNELKVGHKEGTYGFDWNKVTQGLQQMLPGMLEAGRLAGSLYSNAKIYDAKLKGIRPNLVQPYSTHRQVVGDEATKQAYYRRGAQGMTRAAQPFTSDADRQMAYMMEAKRANDELQAQGDIPDNQEIRRTSDESNQHQWANTERYTRAANEDTAQLNYANAAKQDLIAQQHAANWSSWDNYLKSKEYRLRQRQAEAQALDDEIFALQENYELLNDPEVNNAKQNLENIIKKHTSEDNITDWNNQEILAAQRIYQQAQINAAIRSRNRKKQYMSNRYISLAASGTKITRKRKDDLLYKSARDVVEHFRKMSKMSDDSTQRSRPKRIFELNSHPGKTRRMQQGGVAPFTVFTPVALGGETSTQVSSTGASTGSKKSSDSEGKETLDLIKSLFQKIEGLPIDVNTVYKQMSNFLGRAKAFGTELSTNDIASMYLQSMQQLSNLKYSQEVYNKAKALATNNDALSEFAVTATGHYIVQDDESNFSEEKTWKDVLESGKSPVTNQQLLNLRAYSPNLAFRQGDALIENVIGNGMGVNKIGAQIKALAGDLGESDTKIEGLTQVESGKVKSGLQILANAPDGYYKYTKTNKNQQEQVNAALKYIENMLSPSQKAILETHGGTKPLIAHFLASQTDTTEELTISPLTGKASDKDNSKDSSEGLKLDAATALISGKGYQGAIEFNPGTSYAVTVNARHSGFQKKSGENMGSGITMQEATTSTLDKVLDWNKATLGGSRLNPTGYNRIMINSDDVVGVDLPVGSDKNTPDFTMLQKLQVLDQELLKKGIEDTPNNWKQINQVCQEIGLPAKYKNDGSLNEYSWNRFAAFQVTADDSVLVDKNAILSDILGVVEDDNVREQYEQAIQKDNKNYKLGSGFLGLGKQALYQGTVFVPINSSYVASALSGGQNISMQQATNLELRERGYDQQKIATYKPGININEL